MVFSIGLPASSCDDSPLVGIFETCLLTAAIVSIEKSNHIGKELIIEILEKVKNKTEQEKLPIHPDYITIIPEIVAQLSGYILSDKFDRRRPKFMLVDVGGGTVDAAIVNVTSHVKGENRYSFLKADVKALGILMLDAARIDWIKASLKNAKISYSVILSDLDKIALNFDGSMPVTDKVTSYLNNVKWPKDFSLDTIFYKEYANMLFQGLILPVKKDIDMELEQWKSLKFLLCGGGSLHSLYRVFVEKINNNKSLDLNLLLVGLGKPEKLVADNIDLSNYHRLSVAYGLSNKSSADVVLESSIGKMEKVIENEKNKPCIITKEMV